MRLFGSKREDTPAEALNKVWQVKVYSGGYLIDVGRLEILNPAKPSGNRDWSNQTSFSFIEIDTGDWKSVMGTIVIEAVLRSSPRPRVTAPSGSATQEDR